MNEKEFNLAILAELKRIAKEVFAKVKVSKEGTYTAAELWNGKNSMGEKIGISYMGTSSDIYTAKVDTFEFQVSAEDVFLRLWKFEKLCKIRQEDKARFTYGEAKHEIVNEKAMYYTGIMERGNYDEKLGYFPVIGDGNYKVVTRKTTLKKISENLAVDKKGKPYYKAGEMWYLINDRELSERVIERLKNEPDYLFGLLSKWDYSVKCELNAIFKALFEALKSERVNSAPEQRKPENEPENAVICDNVETDTNIKSESVKEANEDFPPEPYNEANTDDTGQKIEKCESSCDNQEKKCIVEHVSDIQGKNMCPNYLRQKVFPTELFNARRKISRFKPRYFIGYTNYHLRKESALERKRNANTSVYRVLIRSETGIISG